MNVEVFKGRLAKLDENSLRKIRATYVKLADDPSKREPETKDFKRSIRLIDQALKSRFGPVQKTLPKSSAWREFATPEQRAYFHSSTEDLEDVAALAWDAPEQVWILRCELEFRSVARAKNLRAVVDARIDELKQTFKWPTADAGPSTGDDAGEPNWPIEGMLKHLGYRVGISGKGPDERREVLDHIFTATLPVINSETYWADYGAPGAPRRLEKMATSIVSFIRQQKRRRSGASDLAVEHWQADLAYLHDAYYRSHFGFVWPTKL